MKKALFSLMVALWISACAKDGTPPGPIIPPPPRSIVTGKDGAMIEITRLPAAKRPMTDAELVVSMQLKMLERTESGD